MRRLSCLLLLLTRVLAGILVVTMLLTTGITRGEQIAMDALTHLDQPYVFGNDGPDRFDCSGLVKHCFGGLGISVSHSAEEIGTDERYRRIDDPSRLMTGDIVCFDTIADRDPSDHVGIWLGGDTFVHASSGKGKVIVSHLDGYYLEHFTCGRRIICPFF